MIFEVLFDHKHINRNPKLLMLVGAVYSSVALFLSFVAFRSYASVAMVFFTVMALLPLMYNSIKHEEHEDLVLTSERSKLREHAKALTKFMYLFIGMVLAFSFWYTVIPLDVNAEIFEAQISAITRINKPLESVENQVTGNIIRERLPIFLSILMNNMVVLIFCLIFSLLFGLGAIFILTWNASIIGVAIGTIFKEGFAASAQLTGIGKSLSYAQVLSYGLFRFALHGVPEIAGYFIGGLAGGILSVAVIRHDLRSKRFSKIVFDSIDLALISVTFIFLAAVLEVFVTPIFF
jgi:uncharacterized membrane protein SpoIIM required for sporulation